MNISPHLLIDAGILSSALTIILILRAKGNAVRKGQGSKWLQKKKPQKISWDIVQNGRLEPGPRPVWNPAPEGSPLCDPEVGARTYGNRMFALLFGHGAAQGRTRAGSFLQKKTRLRPIFWWKKPFNFWPFLAKKLESGREIEEALVTQLPSI